MSAWGAPLADVHRAAQDLRAAAALAGVPLAPTDRVQEAAAVAVAELACQVGECVLSTAHRASHEVRVALSRALRLAGGAPVAHLVPTAGACTDKELAWVEDLGEWADHVSVERAALLRLVAGALADLDGPLGRVAAACDDLADYDA